jgi:hypothetical protein
VSHPDPNMWRIPRKAEHMRQLVPVTMTMTKSSATLTYCSTMSEPSGPEYVAYSVQSRAQASVGPRDNDNDKVVSDTYVLRHHG